jgi:hypothetical protein
MKTHMSYCARRGIPARRIAAWGIPLPFTKVKGQVLSNASELLQIAYISKLFLSVPVNNMKRLPPYSLGIRSWNDGK